MPRVSKPCTITSSSAGSTTVQHSTVRRNTEQFGRVINFRVEEPLPRTQLFLRWRPMGTYIASTERKRTSKHEYAAIQHSNRSSKQHVIYFQREGKLQRRPTGADYADCFAVQHASTTATRVDEQPATIPPPPTPLERLEQLGQFPFLSSSRELQQQPTSSHGPVASIQQADGGFTPEIPNKYVRDIESANQISAASTAATACRPSTSIPEELSRKFKFPTP